MGQGMAAGIRDAANLAWKLHDIIRYEPTFDLVKSYHSERLSHAKEFIQGAVNFGNIIQNYCGDIAYQEQVAQLKNFVTPIPKLGAGFVQQDADNNGMIAPQFILDQQHLSDDVVDYQFGLFVLPEYQQHIEELELNEIESLSIIYAHDALLAQWLYEQQAHAILVRPDRYIFGKASATQSIEQLLKATYLYDVITH